MKQVALTNGMMTLVSDEHYIDILNVGPWHYQKEAYRLASIRYHGEFGRTS